MAIAKKPLALAMGAAFALGGTAAGASNLFQATELSGGYMVADAHGKTAPEAKCGEAKCGEGKCGAAMQTEAAADKKADAQCGAAKKDDKKAAGNDGAAKKADAQCGAGH